MRVASQWELLCCARDLGCLTAMANLHPVVDVSSHVRPAVETSCFP